MTRQMVLSELEILLNPSVRARGELRLSRQAAAIYKLLQQGSIKTSQLAAIAKQYNARINEIRHAIVRIGLMIDETEGSGGENQYRIVPLDESTFWKKVKVKNEQWKW